MATYCIVCEIYVENCDFSVFIILNGPYTYGGKQLRIFYNRARWLGYNIVQKYCQKTLCVGCIDVTDMKTTDGIAMITAEHNVRLKRSVS